MEIEALRIVTLVARQGSFAAAARVLGCDPSTVSRSVAAVEAELGLRLFLRTTRSLRPTDEGARFLAQVSPLIDEFDRACDAARGRARSPTGLLRMTASVAFMHECIVPLLGQFRDSYPDLELELLPTDAMLDLAAEGIDLAIRLAPTLRGDLVCTKLMRTTYMVCASPDYLLQAGAPDTPKDLVQRDCLRFALPEHRGQWRFRKPGAPELEVPVSGSLVIGNALSLRQAARDGLGPALLADWLVRGDLASGRLVRLFDGYQAAADAFDTAAWAVYPSRHYLPAKTRAALDFFRNALRPGRANTAI